MDNYLNQFFSSSSWSDVDVKERSSWGCCESAQPNEMLLNSAGVDEDDNNSSPTFLTNSNHSMESLAAQDASSVVHDLESDAQDDGKNFKPNLSNGKVDGSFKVENPSLQFDVDIVNPCSLASLEQLPLNGNMVRTSLSAIEPENVVCNNREPSIFERFNGDFETLSSISQLWPLQSYEGVPSSFSPGMGQHRMCSFGLKGEYGDNGTYAMPNDPNNLAALVTTEGKQDLQNYPLPSFASRPQITMVMSGLQSLPQATSTTPSAECTGTGKPRMRARRGQATDPHSIAERLRREKIAERMKNLQELVPNSNRTDKASMLDEIIEYVKFLQLQIKVLSMSRVGAAGAVVPLITDTQQAKGANGSSLLPSVGQVTDISFNEIALEQVVRLMESDVTKAMQHLQSKGLCLMPIALADAISTEKKSSSSPAPASDDWKKTGFNDSGLVQNNSSSSSSSSLPDVKQEAKNHSFAAR
ncbi:hypothetical protein CerSpe_258070 [Prunus speciosa]